MLFFVFWWSVLKLTSRSKSSFALELVSLLIMFATTLSVISFIIKIYRASLIGMDSYSGGWNIWDISWTKSMKKLNSVQILLGFVINFSLMFISIFILSFFVLFSSKFLYVPFFFPFPFASLMIFTSLP